MSVFSSLSRGLSAIRILVLFGSLSIFGLLGLQVYWVKMAYDNEEKQFTEACFAALDAVARKMAAANQTTIANTGLVKQVTTNYFTVNINSQIDANVLQHYLKSGLKDHGLLTDFEYGIYDCSTERVVYGAYVTLEGTVDPTKAEPEVITTHLPVYRQTPYFFTVRFPNKASYFVSKLDFYLVTTVIIAIIVLFFGYALFIILRQKRLSEVQRDFINNMTHEFKTPISTINLAAGIIGKHEIIEQPKRLENYARIIKEESLRLNGLVERVLQVARTENKGLSLNPENLDLVDLIRQVAETFDIKGRRADGCLVLDLPQEPVVVQADKLHLTNLLYNLLDNALKYNQRPPELRLRLQTFGDCIHLEVQDNGIGIPDRFQAHVFERFYRVPTGNVHNVKGFGIGLSYVRLVALTHKWKLQLLSFPGQGSIFTLKIRQLAFV